jgi:hypothetical protein
VDPAYELRLTHEKMLMTAQNTHRHDATAASVETVRPAAKKPFVEPQISQPVDVLEATTYFQVVDSGGTGVRKKGGGQPGGGSGRV